MDAVDHGQVLAEIGRTKVSPALARCLCSRSFALHHILSTTRVNENNIWAWAGVKHRPNALQTFF